MYWKGPSTQDTIEDIVFREGEMPPENQPAYIMVRFDNYKGPSIDVLVAIPPIKRMLNCHSGIASRTQIPLILAWAFTIHKA